MQDEGEETVIREAADLLFHLMVLLESHGGVAFIRVLEELARRRQVMIMIDYHVHTYLCRHAEGDPQDYVNAAVEKGG